MNKLTKYAHHFTKLELMKARLDVFQNEMKHGEIRPGLKNQTFSGQSGSRGVDYIVKAGANYHELYLQVINLEKDRSIKIPKQDLGEPKDNLFVALVLFMKDMEPVLYLIPSKILAQPDDYIFIDNDQGERFKHLSNWEIKVFTKGIQQLSKYALDNMLPKL